MKVHFPFLILIADYPNHIKVWPIQDQSGSISPHFPTYNLLRLPSAYRSQFVLVKIQLKPSIPISSFERPRSFIALKIQEICVFALRFHTLNLTSGSSFLFVFVLFDLVCFQFQLCFFCIAMESISAAEKQNMVSSFLEIAVGQSAETARQFLQVGFLLISFCVSCVCFLCKRRDF